MTYICDPNINLLGVAYDTNRTIMFRTQGYNQQIVLYNISDIVKNNLKARGVYPPRPRSKVPQPRPNDSIT